VRVFEHPNGDLVVPRRAELDGISACQ